MGKEYGRKERKNYTVKLNFFLKQAMKAQKANTGIALLFL
jgi:hypothetical protein